MRRIRIGLLLALALAAPMRISLARQDHPPAPVPDEQVREVLRTQSYPWYDAEKDKVKPILPDSSSWLSRLGRRFDAFIDWLGRRLFGSRSGSSGEGRSNPGGTLVTILFVASGGLLLFVLWRLWKLYEPESGSRDERGKRIGGSARIAALVPGLSLDETDTWAEARRRRAAGDLAGAVIWLFLDQILWLERAGLIRLLPGKTARQYVQSLHDPLIRDGLRSILGAFEDVYYGRRAPDPGVLDRIWTQAEGVRSRLQTIAAGLT
jgi:hypothetical protein